MTENGRSLRRAAAVAILAALLGPALAGCVNPSPALPQANIVVTEAAFLFSDPPNFGHVEPRQYVFRVQVNITNTGNTALTFESGFLTYRNETSKTSIGRPSALLLQGESTTWTGHDVVSDTAQPDLVTFTDGDGHAFTAPVPPPTLPAPELTITNLTVLQVDTNRTGEDPRYADAYLWVNLTLTNRYSEAINLTWPVTIQSFSIDFASGRSTSADPDDGRSTLEAGASKEVRLTFPSLASPGPGTLLFESFHGPWATAALPAPPPLVHFNSPSLIVLDAAWLRTDSTGGDLGLGYYYLAVHFAVENAGIGPFRPGLYAVEWGDGDRTDEWFDLTWGPSETRDATAYFPPAEASSMVPGTKAPLAFVLHYGAGHEVRDIIPSPLAPGHQAIISNISSYATDFNLFTMSYTPGTIWLVVEFDLFNNWTENLTTSTFELSDAAGSRLYGASDTPEVPALSTYSSRIVFGYQPPFDPVWLLNNPIRGPWANESLPPPTHTVHAYVPNISITSAEWRYESVYGYHTTRGNWSLWLNVTLKNDGALPLEIQPAMFDMWWSGAYGPTHSQGAFPISFLEAGNSTNLTVEFLSTVLRLPDHIVYLEYPTGAGTNASVPAPTGPFPEAALLNLSASWNATGWNNVSASAGNRFLWVDLDVRNLWNRTIFTIPLDFRVNATDGSSYSSTWLFGPDINVSATEHYLVIFEVPDTWQPLALRLDATSGPWTDVAVPMPT